MTIKQGEKESGEGGLTNSPSIPSQAPTSQARQNSQQTPQNQQQNPQQSPKNTQDIIKLLLKELIQKYNLKKEDLLDAVQEKDDNDLPISIFNTKELSSLEAISKYLHEDKQLKFSQIAELTKRDSRTIWSSYQFSKKKHPAKLIIRQSEIKIPLHQLTDRSISVLESIVAYLKENYNLSYHQIAILVNRNDRTIWTVYSRYKKKVMTHA